MCRNPTARKNSTACSGNWEIAPAVTFHVAGRTSCSEVEQPAHGVMFVGEAPGFHEDMQGLPFVGAAGKLLSRFLEEIGLKRSDVYITNIVKCRPPDNRDPLSEEIETCRGFLSRQIDIINPDLICTLGNHATRTLLGRPVSITRIRGKAQEFEGHFVFPMLHPAAALHKGDMMEKVREDFKNLRKFLDRKVKAEPAQKQLELF